ncbi:DNA topoisomerase [Bacteroidia bacterium]|nr:DNA topoisomerase [Bacteroidia bacterium]
MIAIITDKEAIAKQIALALNMDAAAGDAGYFQGRGFTLVWADGELLSLLPPEERLTKNGLPFIPEALAPCVRKRKTKRKAVTDRAAVRCLDIIRKAFDESESIIVATDAGEAGELAFRRIYSYLVCGKPFRRLWLDSLAAGAIREGFKNLKEGSLFDSLYAAADCRAKADFLTAVNAGSAFALATGLAGSPLGRLEIPVLAMICRRYGEYRKFVSTRFYEHRATLGKDGLLQGFALPVPLKSRRKAEKIYGHLKTFHPAQVIKVEAHSRIQPAPQLYGMVSLQREANTRYGFPAQKTLEIARKLYEGKLVSHPLTDSRHIPENVFEAIPKTLRQAAACCGLADKLYFLNMESLNRGSVKGGNCHPATHHALVPTGVYPGCLPKEEKAVYEMVACRSLEAFAPDCRKEFTRVEAAPGNLILVSGKSRITAPGWRSILSREEDREADEAGGNDAFPWFTEGEAVRISGWNLLTHKTIPRPLYTEASLLSAMEGASLGTAAARAAVIESLFACNYIERRGHGIRLSNSLMANICTDMLYLSTKDRDLRDRLKESIRQSFRCDTVLYGNSEVFDCEIEFDSKWTFPQGEMEKLTGGIPQESGLYIRVPSYEFGCGYAGSNIYAGGEWRDKFADK